MVFLFGNKFWHKSSNIFNRIIRLSSLFAWTLVCFVSQQKREKNELCQDKSEKSPMIHFITLHSLKDYLSRKKLHDYMEHVTWLYTLIHKKLVIDRKEKSKWNTSKQNLIEADSNHQLMFDLQINNTRWWWLYSSLNWKMFKSKRLLFFLLPYLFISDQIKTPN